MAHFKILPKVNENVYRSCLFSTAVTDADVGKPVKWAATDEYTICADGEVIDGFIHAVDPAPQGGKVFGTVQVWGSRCVQLDGAVTMGNQVEAAAPATLGTAETGYLGQVSTHTPAAADHKKWRLISGTGLDGDLTAVVSTL